MNYWDNMSIINFDVNFDFLILGHQQKQGEGVCQATRYVGSNY
jgi:hypothetical protein